MIIRGYTIQFSSLNKKRDAVKENKLEKEIKIVEEISANISNIENKKMTC